MQGTIVEITVQEGDAVREGTILLIMDSMKMEHEIKATVSGIVRQIAVSVGDTIYHGHPLVFISEEEVEEAETLGDEAIDPDDIRPDLKSVLDRRTLTRDAARPEAVARRRGKDQRTARENIGDLCDPGTCGVWAPGTGGTATSTLR